MEGGNAAVRTDIFKNINAFDGQLVKKNPSNSAWDINMREELNKILYGGDGNTARGHWVIYRRFDHNVYSPFWDPVKGTAVGGPKYEWKDTLLRTRRFLWDMSQETNRGLEAELRSGYMQPGDFLYYFEYDIEPQEGDCLMEIEEHWSPGIPAGPFNVLEKMDFKRVEPMFGDEGRIEYYLIVARKTGGTVY